MIKFEKVSEEQAVKDGLTVEVLSEIKMPKRATLRAAGYDFYAPFDISLEVGETCKVPTGIRCYMSEEAGNAVLSLFPRSGLGFKNRLQLDNTVGIVDADYYHADNEGHIFIKITNDGKEGKPVHIKKGEGFAQGILFGFLTTSDDDKQEKEVRTGGFGSTTK